MLRWSHATTTSHLATVVVKVALVMLRRTPHVALHTEAALLLLQQLRHVFEQHLQVVLHLLLVGKVSPLGIVRVGLTELLEVVLVLLCLVLKLTYLFDFVVIDRESLVINCDLFFGRRGLIRFLEADKGVEFLFLIRWVHLKALNFSVGCEKVTELLLCICIGEAFHVEIASLLGALVLDGFANALSLSISSLKCFFDIKLFIIWYVTTTYHCLPVQTFYRLLRAQRAVLTVVFVF